MSQNSDTPSDMFIRTLERTDMPFTSLKMLSRPTRPIIGYTEDKRGIAPHLYRIGQWLRLRLARFDVIPYGERDESDDGYCCGGYYRKRSWKWVDRLADRCRRLAPQPIYDMEWVDPNPPVTKMTWGWSSLVGDEDKPCTFCGKMDVFGHPCEIPPPISYEEAIGSFFTNREKRVEPE